MVGCGLLQRNLAKCLEMRNKPVKPSFKPFSVSFLKSVVRFYEG